MSVTIPVSPGYSAERASRRAATLDVTSNSSIPARRKCGSWRGLLTSATVRTPGVGRGSALSLLMADVSERDPVQPTEVRAEPIPIHVRRQGEDEVEAVTTVLVALSVEMDDVDVALGQPVEQVSEPRRVPDLHPDVQTAGRGTLETLAQHPQRPQ